MVSVTRLTSFGSKSAKARSGLLLSAVAAVGFLLTGASASAQTTTVAGVTPGAIAVDESGSANYSIPISVPPGVAGMAPSLSLIYGSRGDNGILGVGWSLGGLSVIHRCGKTLAQDNEIDGVDYSADDRFCLDGQRLVATDGGVYGANGTTYSTELASFSKIVSYGTVGTGPAYFKVWTKSGQIMTYGNTADSAVEVPGQQTVRYWSVSRIEDRVGNYLTLSYSDDTTNNVHQIDRIDYAGNTAAGTLPTASVRFVYEARTDTRVHYMADVRTQTLNRLKAIETYAKHGGADTLVKRYNMAYEYSTATGRSRLTSVTECDASNNCLEPHSFTYSGHPRSLHTSNITHASWQDAYHEVATLDYNGDGKTDVILQGKDTSQKTYLLEGGSGYAARHDITQSWFMSASRWSADRRRLHVLDMNGDSVDDMLLQGVDSSQKTYLLLSNGQGGYNQHDVTNSWGMGPAMWATSHRNLIFHDHNGDGLTDILVQSIIYNNNSHLLINDGNSGFHSAFNVSPSSTLHYTTWAGVNRNAIPMDYNGDGLTDILLQWTKQATPQGTYIVLSNGNGYDPAIHISSEGNMDMGHWSADRRTIIPFEYNGDGLTDLLLQGVNGDNTPSLILVNNGNGFNQNAFFSHVAPTSDPSVGQNRGRLVPFDYNGDGLDDILLQGKTKNHTSYLFINDGSGFGSVQNITADTWSTEHRNLFVVDEDGDGAADILMQARGTNAATASYMLKVNNPEPVDLLVSAEDGLGRMASITYKPLTDSSVFTKGGDRWHPEIDIQAPMYVVSSVSQDDGKTETPGNLEGQAAINYTYAGAKVNRLGRGFLGFRTVTARDEQTGILTTTTYNQTYPFTGQVDSSVTRLDNGAVVDLVKDVASTYAQLTIFDGTATGQPSVLFPYASSSTSKAYEIADSTNTPFLVSSTTTTTTYDNYGNALNVTQSVTDETTGATGGQVFTTETASLYDNDEVNWILGRVTSTTVTKSRPDGAGGTTSQSRKSAWEYNATNGLLTKEIIEPDLPALKVTTSYTYDVFGNETAVTVDGAGVTARTSTTTYDANGQFPLSSANALGHSESMVTDARFGVVTSLTGPNGITTTWLYDGFGRKTKELRADGTESRIAYELCDALCQPGAVYKITTQDFLTAGGTALNTPSVQYYDKMNRVFRTESIAFDGVTKIYVDTRYDPRGESHMVSRPYFEGTAANDIKWATTHYDVLSRRMSVIAPDGGIQEFDYGGLSTQTTNALFQTETKTQNAIGELVLSEDHLNGTVTYSYDAYGNLLETNANGVITTLSYDQRGRKTGMTDADMGTWSYSYNVLGELTSQTDAKNQVITMAYDVLGRMTSRVEAEGTTTWTYDTATKGIGKIHQVSGPNGYLEVATYDSLGRPDTTATTISGTVYNTSLTYDAQGRPDTITYPSGFAVKNNYTANGFLGSVSEVLGGTVYWQADTVDAEGMVTQETLGNGVVTSRAYDPATALLDSIQTTKSGTNIQNLAFVFDTLGNLKEREDLTRNRKEVFGYDGLNRVLSTTLTDTSTTSTLNTTTYSYDALGNITFKSDVGNYLYGQNGAGPHAVTTAGANTYTYDANGSMISGAGRTTAWTSFNKPQNIADSATGNWTSFVYGPDRGRIQQNAQTNGITTTTTYVGGSYEKRSRLNEPDELVHYIRAGGTVAIYTEIDDGNSLTNKTRYLHKDHLGSVESITDEQGVVTEHLSYDAHGKRRQSDWAAGTPAIPNETPRGFTGHEHLDGVGLIHMNGRVYDPTLGRFLSADPHVQAPSDTQSFNRYTYVKNNPLSYTDPSGFFFKKLFKKITDVAKKAFKGFVSLVKKALQNEIVTAVVQIAINIAVPGPGGVLLSAAFSGLVTLANGGDLGQALMSAGITVASALAFHGVGELLGHETPVFLSFQHIAKTVAHGAVGGAISELRGGEFKSGFLAGAFTQFVAPALSYVDQYSHPGVGVAAAAVAGGVGEELGGGKFTNGAITGAFSRLYNDNAVLSDGGEPGGGWLDGFQLGLDVVGLIPVVGNAADLLNAGISLARGDYVGAGASLAAAAPGAGQGVGLANIGRRLAGRVCSFRAGTLVHTKDGLRPIEAIRVGDLVAAKDEKTGEVAWKPVVHLFRSKDKPILDLALVGSDGEVDIIEATAEHPFWVEGKGWVQTSALAANDEIEAIEGEDLVVQSVMQRPGAFPAYNFEVADFHTYFVGEDGAWVHNANCGHRLWQVTKERTVRTVKHDRYGKFHQGTDGLWFSRDTAGHGNSAWKVYRKEGNNLVWQFDADQYGTKIVGKHKSSASKIISFKDLNASEF